MCLAMVNELLESAISNVKCWKCCCDESQQAAKLTIEKMVGALDEKEL